MWWAMKLARGEKIVRSVPRSCICFSWLAAMLSRSSSSVIFRSAASATIAGSVRLAICRLRQPSSAFGAVV